jgi:ubiquinone/menaquinone biosynthesis C-methylase UbiE
VKLRSQQDQWEELGRTDALWAILNDPRKQNGGWDEGEFFATGQSEIAELMARASALGLPAARRAALDFGCGVGRLAQALSEYFDEVTGVDIAPAMLERARRYNRHGDRCRYVLNTQNHLRVFPSACFDLVYSRITLQHLPRRHIRSYLAEFIRILRPEGLLVFQLPDRYRNWRYLISRSAYRLVARRLLHRVDVMEMYGIPRKRVVAFLEEHEARVLGIEEDPAAGAEWLSWRFFVTRRD